ncbi:aldehyde dehydrogenase family protein [Herbaspirillum sp. alder98]|uniref:aldehyde dehydrogenase family protein n=1 Tax=Herbaspirillum sp. alder98 TaxID=2913096 RepID=UPI001CD8435B|nr:aldehyde dehydrogenase family protein [Herbaspirillum sp. alder98]MCA1322994.1 aldehyde dehydrogenase family protein [Herbaspirillum sp. alder98]
MSQFANLINGEWLQGAGVNQNINPSDLSDIIGDYAQADAAQTEIAIAAAHAAFPAWSVGNIQARSDALDKIGTEILARREELGTLLSREEGKTVPEGIGEATRAGNIFKFFAAEVLRIRGEKLASVRPGMDVEITREPLGVIGIIAPWNFPLAIPAWKIAPALAYGNTVVFKPAELVPGSGWAIAEIISRSGIPAGVFNLVMGRGSVVGQRFIDDRRVAGISFTGSVATGNRVAQGAIARMAKFQLEMGGKNPMVVLNDADLDVAVTAAVQGAFFSTGQRCTASSRLIVEKGIYPRFIEAAREQLSKVRVGHALQKETHIGPVVDQSQLDQDLSYVAIAKDEGARLVSGGERISRDTEGFFMAPALFADADNNMRISREEVFGPVAAVIPADNYEHALALANDTEFGLSSGICTTSLKYATHFKRHAQAGMVMVNTATAGVDYHVPFGGRKGSSYGSREQGAYAAEFYTTVKTSYTQA